MERRELASRVAPGAYYTDGQALFEVERVSDCGSVRLIEHGYGGGPVSPPSGPRPLGRRLSDA
jgi:hypothetical protein